MASPRSPRLVELARGLAFISLRRRRRRTEHPLPQGLRQSMGHWKGQRSTQHAARSSQEELRASQLAAPPRMGPRRRRSAVSESAQVAHPGLLPQAAGDEH